MPPNSATMCQAQREKDTQRCNKIELIEARAGEAQYIDTFGVDVVLIQGGLLSGTATMKNMHF